MTANDCRVGTRASNPKNVSLNLQDCPTSKAASAASKTVSITHYNFPVKSPLKTASHPVGRVNHHFSSREESPLLIPNYPGIPSTAGIDANLAQPSLELPIDKSGSHWFSRPFARKIGVPDAVILKFLSYKITRSKNVHDGKRWFYETIPAISRHFPYLTEAAVEEALRRNAGAGRILRGNYNHQRRDRTTWYSMSPETMNLAEKEPIGFRLFDASTFDLKTAVLLAHLVYRAGRALSDEPDRHGEFSLSPKEASGYLPISKTTIERKIAVLLEHGVVSRCGERRGVGIYRLAGPYSDRVVPIAKPASNTRCPSLEYQTTRRSNPKAKVLSSAKAGVTASSTQRTSSEEPQQKGWRIEQMRELVAANERYIAALCPVDKTRVIREASTLTLRVLNVLESRNLLETYWASFVPNDLDAYAPDDLLARLRSSADEIELKGSVAVVTLADELLCIAFSKRTGASVPHSSVEMLRAGYRFVWETIHPAIQKIQKARAILRHEEHRRKHDSLDKDKETLVDITPAEKIRVLRNGINAANNQGFLDSSNKLQPRHLRFDRIALGAAERFYQINPAWSALDLIRLMIKADAMNSEASTGQYDESWHSKKASDLRFLLCNLDPVLQGFGMVDQMPPFQPIDKAYLFPTKSKLKTDSP